MTARQPPEWAPHEWVWIGFPSHADLWEDDLESARAEVIAFARAVDAGGKGEQVRLVAADPESTARARELAGPDIEVVQEMFGDIWLRDTAPLILKGPGKSYAADFAFNGWGGKYELEGDDTIGRRLPISSRGDRPPGPSYRRGGGRSCRPPPAHICRPSR